MACGRPVILAAEGEARRILEAAGAGIAVPPEEPDALLRAILRLRDDPDLRRRQGQAGRAAVEAHYSRRDQALRLEQLLGEVVGGDARP
jgi:glycosyltransferase involved in cell wall biosynthesis